MTRLIYRPLSQLVVFLMILLVASCSKDNITGVGRFSGNMSCTVIAPPSGANLNSYYKKYLNCTGIPVVGSAAISDEALFAVNEIIEFMLRGNEQIRDVLVEEGAYYALTPTGGTGLNDAPEVSGASSGNAGVTYDNVPVAVSGMDNVLCLASNFYTDGNGIVLHEFVHLMHLVALKRMYSSFDSDLKAEYNNAMGSGLWSNTHAVDNFAEYIACGVGIWYGVSPSGPTTGDGNFNHIVTRSQLQQYDPGLHSFITSYFHSDTDVPGCIPPNIQVPNTTCDATVTDIEGNVYGVVSIGSQCWMTENLKTTTYRDGTPIPNITNGTDWANDTDGAWCYYDHDPQNDPVSGKLYNWYAVSNTKGICPNGWHVPTFRDWQQLVFQLGGREVAGGKMKKNDAQWSTITGNNESNFSGLPGGRYFYEQNSMRFAEQGFVAVYWSDSEADDEQGRLTQLTANSDDVWMHYNLKQTGYSCRCVKD